MRYTNKAPTRILSMIFVVIFMFTALPSSAFAAIDEPLNGVTGNGWDDFDGSSDGYEADPLPVMPDSSTQDTGNDGTVGKTAPDADREDETGGQSEAVSAPENLSIGTSGVTLDLPADVLADFIAFMENATKAIESPYIGIMPMAGVGDTGTISWSWGETADFNAGGYYCNQIPSLSLSTARPSEGRPFCAQFGPNPLTGGTYKAAAYSNPTILKLMIAFNEGKASAVGVQLAIWSITNNASAFATHPEAAAAMSAASSVSTDGYTLLRWTTSGSYQPFFTLERELNDSRLKIIKKSTSGKLLAGATFSVSGPGVNQTGLVTNSRGEILVDIPMPGGVFVVTETAPADGYLPADPDSQTVTINTTNPSGTVVFENEPEGEEEPGASAFRVEVETEVETKVDVRNEKEIEYSRAYGQFTIRKHDQDGKSLDGALFNIEVRFTDGTILRENNWEVDNGARLFTYQHPENNHDPATITVWESQPPRYYTGDPTPKTVTVQPSYTRTIISMTWTETVWTYFYRYTVIEIDPSGEETEVDSWTESRDEFEVTPGNIENFPEYVPGDREITVTFVNQRITGTIIVTKRDANTGQALAGATVHLWGTDLGEPSNIDRTIVTGADGTAVFDNLPPGTYSYQETQPPFSYNLNDELQTAILQSGQTLHKEIRNYRKDGLIIKKVDQDGKPLAGAVFELRRGSGEVLLRETTNENGIIFRDYLVEDTYVCEELSAPEGFLLDENPVQSIRIYKTDDNKQYTVTFVNKKKPSIEIIKIDGDTPTLRLEGAVFRITNSRTGQYWDIQTGKDGTALLENLDLNTTYICEERDAPQNYVNSGYRQEIVLKECRKHTITVANHHMPKLTIIKKDKSTGALLPGATFRVSWNNGADYRDVTTDENGEAVITGLTPGWFSITEKNQPSGYLLDSTTHQVLIVDGQDKVIELFNEAKPSLKIIKVDSVTKTPLQYAEFSIYKKDDSGERYIGKYISDENGEIYLEDIEPGRFLIKEEKAPDGFNIDTESHEITINPGQKYELEFTNTPKSPIYILKVDDKGNPLMGAKFKVTTMNGAMVGTVTSGRTGYAIIPYVDVGVFCVEEVQSADGFILSSTPVIVEVKSGRPAQVEFVNYKKPQLTILKLDAATNKALIGARIKVTKANGEVIGTYTTDNNGLITLTDLDADVFVITEIAAPDAYILDTTPQIVTLKPGESKQIELYNTAKPGLQLKKLDKLTNMPVKGTVFSLVRLESGAKRDIGTFTTNESGLFYVPDLIPGDYVITEISVSSSYILDPTPKNIYIEGGRLNTIEVFNMPYSALRILKISADDSRKPLEGAIFKLFDEKRLEIGTYETSALGEILIPQLPAGIYYYQEQKAPSGFVLDTTVRKVELIGGKTTVVEVKNQELGSLRIIKRSKEDGKPLYGATFLLYDSKNNLLGEFTTNQDGVIAFGRNLSAGVYKIKECKAPDSFVLDDTIRTVTVKEGETTEIVIENEPKRGQIQITKKASDYNDITKDKKGALLEGAVFEIIDSQNKVVDRIKTNSRGVATSKLLPLAVYGIREITALTHYLLNDKVFYAEIKLHNDLIQFEVLNEPADISVTVQKYGNYEAIPGQNIRYDFKDIANTSTVELDDFYFHDAIPTDAVRLVSISTGTYNERLTFKALYKTNQRDYRVLEDKLSTKTVNEIDCRRETLKLKNGEYITDIKFEFGTVQPGFKEVTQPFIICTVNGDLPNEYRFTNRCDAGGQREDTWCIAKDAWVTIIYAKPGGKGKLPKTGF